MIRTVLYILRILESIKRLFGPVFFWAGVFIAIMLGMMWAAPAFAQVACEFGYNLDGDITSVGSSARSKTAQAITTGADACALETLSISVSKESGRSDNLRLSVYSDAGGEPDASLATATVIPAADIATGLGNEALETTPISYTLQPSTTYWLVAEGTGSLDPDVVYYIDRGTDGGTTFEYLPNAGAWTTGNASYNLLFYATGTVEEAATSTATTTTEFSTASQEAFFGYVLFFFGMLSVIWIFRRRE